MKSFLTKIRHHWATLSSDHPYSSKALIVAAVPMAASGALAAKIALDVSAGVITGLGGAAAISFAAAVVTTGVAASLAVLAVGAGLFLYERQQNKKIETITTPDGQSLQGPHWALERFLKTQKRMGRLMENFNPEVAMTNDIAGLPAAITVLETTAGKPDAASYRLPQAPRLP